MYYDKLLIGKSVKGVSITHLQESGEMYLETIYVLSLEKNAVRSIDIANHMGFSKPSVTRGLGLLKDDGFIEKDSDGHIILTEKGRNHAIRIYERHTLLTDLFIKIGVDEQTAADDACRIEHYISDKTFDAIKAYVKKKELQS